MTFEDCFEGNHKHGIHIRTSEPRCGEFWSSLTESLSKTRKYAVLFHNVVTNISVSHRINRLNSLLFHWTSTTRGAKSEDGHQTIFGVLAEKAECLCQWAIV